MEKGRSNYEFNIICDVNLINSLMQNYIQANNFILEEKDRQRYYKSGDSMIGYRYFNYSINGNHLMVSAWLKGAFGEIKIEQNGIASMNIQSMDFRNSLSSLFQEIEKLNNGGNVVNNQNLSNQNNSNQTLEQGQSSSVENIQTNYANNNTNVNQTTGQTQFAQTFQNDTMKKQEKLCEIGFWVSILGLLASFGGVVMGIFVYIMDFYFASQGLKTRKKGKAIATIVLSIISIIVVVMQFIMA